MWRQSDDVSSDVVSRWKDCHSKTTINNWHRYLTNTCIRQTILKLLDFLAVQKEFNAGCVLLSQTPVLDYVFTFSVFRGWTLVKFSDVQMGVLLWLTLNPSEKIVFRKRTEQDLIINCLFPKNKQKYCKNEFL